MPVLFTGQPKMLKANPLTVRFSYKKAAKWSDGKAITGTDFRFLWQTEMNQSFDITSREGWEDISKVAVAGKTVTVTFRRPYAAWKALIGTAPIPQHSLQGEDFNQVWRNDFMSPKNNRPISSGPFVFNRWQRGSQLVLTRNPNYWGKKSYLNQIVYRVVADTNTQFQAIRSGELSVLRPQPQLQIADARRNNEPPGPVRAGVLVGAHRHAAGPEGSPGAQAEVRPPGAHPRHQPVRDHERAVPDDLAGPPGPAERDLQAVRVAVQAELEEVHVQPRGGRAAAPHEPLHEGLGRDLQLPERRQAVVPLHVDRRQPAPRAHLRGHPTQLKAVGIEVKSAFGPASHVFGTVLPSRDWDLFMFGWRGAPSSALTDVAIHGCGGDQNDMGYCNRTVTNLLIKASVELNDRSETRC